MWRGGWAVATVACWWMLGWLTIPAAHAADVHVAVAEGDAAAGDGSARHPVGSLRHALDLARAIHEREPDRDQPVVIELAAGHHQLAEPLVLTSADSGTATSPTIIRGVLTNDGQRPLISGGTRITGWQVRSDAQGRTLWETTLKEVAEGSWRFSELFVNGERRFRPRLPERGWYTIAETLEPSAEAAGKGHDRFGFHAEDIKASWAGSDVEVLAVHRWTMSRMRVAEVDTEHRHVRFTGHTRAPVAWCSFPEGNLYLVENAPEAIGQPGSWYLDRTSGRLTYAPLPGESPEAVDVVVPRLERLVEIRGDLASGSRVEHIRFENLAFAHGGWNLAPQGQSFPQAEVNVGGVMVATAARHIAFDRVTVQQVGRYAFEFGAGCHDCSVERCDLHDLGAGGVLIGTSGGPQSWGTPGTVDLPGGTVERITVADCTIAHGGRLHSAAVGVWIGHASECTIEHNDIGDLYYTGISVGWSWGYAESRTHHNRIAFNHIHDLGQGVLSDMGGIYTLGVSPGTVLEGNHIHHVRSRDYGGWGLYPDEGSTGIVLRNNLVHHTTTGGFHQHYGRDNLVENNIFAISRDWQLQRTRVEDHESFRFERNIVWWNSAAPLVQGDWTKNISTANNCYFNAAGPVTFPGGVDLKDRQAAGQDAGSIVADPGFLDPEGGDFAIRSDSPALQIGFVPWDFSLAGRQTSGEPGLPERVPSMWPEAAVDTARLGPSPDEVQARFQHDAAVRVELAAAEPVVRDPVALCFDETGQLFVAEMGDYPTGPGDDPQAVSRIVQLADADGDGRYESAAVFADQLSFVTGLTAWRGGLVVTLAGEVCWIADTDGDGRADTREPWFAGFTEENTQLRANHPTLAPDGSFYVANGLRGGEVVAADPRWQTTPDEPPVSIRGRDFRFDPCGWPLASGSGSSEAVTGNGQFGLSIDDFGTRFLCSNRNPCMQVMLEDRDIRRNPAAALGVAIHDVSPAGEQSRIFPISSGWTTSNLHAGQFSAACGVTIHRGHGLPAAFHGNAFTCDPTGNLVHRQQLVRSGPAYSSLPNSSRREFLASSHDWFRPVALADGPDGCLYVIDMARAVIEHPQFMPDELKNRPDLLHGRSRGRLWRIAAADRQPAPPAAALAAATDQQLVTLLAHPNGWHRDTASRLLLERSDRLPREDLQTLALNGPTAESRSRALWLLAADVRRSHTAGQGSPSPLESGLLAAALRDPDPRVRGVAVQVSSLQPAAGEIIRSRLLEMAADPDPRVRYRIALRLGEPDLQAAADPKQAVATALAKLLAHDPADPWTRRAVATSASGQAAAVLTSLLPQLAVSAASPTTRSVCVQQFAELAAAEGHADALAAVVQELAAAITGVAADDAAASPPAFACLTGIGQGLARQRQHLDAALAGWPPAMQTAVIDLLTSAAKTATDRTADEALRLQAIDCLAHAPTALATEAITALVQPSTPQTLRLAAIAAADRFHTAAVDDAMLADFGSQTPAVYRQVVASLVARPASAARLLARLESGDTPPLQLSDPQWQRLADCTDNAAERVAALRQTASPEDRQQVVARYAATVDQAGDLLRGRAVFQTQCSSCHRVGEIGVNVGPDISDSRVKQPLQYLSDILDPNRAIDASFFGYTLLTTDGRLLAGIITGETGSSVTLRQADGITTTLLREEVDELRSTGQSLMPVGLERTISPQQMADLICFLKNWRYETAAVTTPPSTP